MLFDDLLSQSRDTDPDLRFMALNDLDKEVTNPESKVSKYEREEYADRLLECLDDEFSEVKSQALKCFETLTPKLDNYVVKVLTKLSHQKPDKISITSSIYTMAIHNILKNVSAADDNTAREIVKQLLPTMLENKTYLFTIIDYIEVVTDLLEYLGRHFLDSELTRTAEALVAALYDAQVIIGKKSVTALALLSRYIKSPAKLKQILTLAADYYKDTKSIKNQHILLSTLTALIKQNPAMLAQMYESDIRGTVLDALKLESLAQVDEDFDVQQQIDENRAEALDCLTAAYGNLPSEVMAPHLSEAAEWCSALISYDPYGGGDEDDDDMEDEEDDYYDEDEDNYEEEEEEDEYGSGISWKLRKGAAVLLATLLDKFPTQLPEIYLQTFDKAVNQLGDSNSGVATEMLKTTTKLFKAAAQDGPYYSLLALNSLKGLTDGARRNSDVSMVNVGEEAKNPSAFLASKSAWVCETLQKLLETADSSRLSVLYGFVGELSNATGGLDDGWGEKIVTRLDELREGPPTFELVKFYSSILANNSLPSLGTAQKLVTANLVKCLQSNHELIMETMALLRTILAKYVSRDGLSEKNTPIFNGELADMLIKQATNKNSSSEIRREALLTLYNWVLNAPLDSQRLADAVGVFASAISLEFLVAADMECIGELVKSEAVVNVIDHSWTQQVVKPLLEYVSDNDLRSQALTTLDTLVSAGIVSDAEKVQAVSTLVEACAKYKLETKDTVTVGKILSGILNTTADVGSTKPLAELLVKFSKDAAFDHDVVAELTKALLKHIKPETLTASVLKFGKRTDSGVSRILAVISVSSNQNESISEVLDNLKADKDVLFSLVFLQQASKSMDLGCGLEPFLNYFNSSDAEIKDAAVHAAAALVVSKPKEYLPHLLQVLESHQSTEYGKGEILESLALVLRKVPLNEAEAQQAFNAITAAEKSSTGSEDLEKQRYVAAAECLAILASDSKEMVESLCDVLLSEPSLEMKAAAAAAAKFLLAEDNFLADDGFLLSKYLELATADSFLFSAELAMKRIGVSNLILAVHRSPSTILPLVSKLLPKILDSELAQKKEYVKVLWIGPFKHKLDDALDFRKELYELIYSTLTTLENNPKLAVLFQVDWEYLLRTILARAFKDDPTIIFLCLLIVLKLVNMHPDIFLGNDVVSDFVRLSNKKLHKKLKENAPKQDIEKHDDTIKAVLRCSRKMDQLITKGTVLLDGDSESQWHNYIADARAKFPIYDTQE